MELTAYIVRNDSTIFETLKKIDRNKKGFVTILDDCDVIQGTITDGDIRRALLKGKGLEASVNKVMSTDFAFVYEHDPFDKLIEIFKTSRIDFLPILNNNRKLTNIVTKKQFHTALLEGIDWDLQFDFSTLDDRTIDHEIYNRPWGYYKTVFLSDYSRVKIIQVNPGEELSLQEHKKREEYWVIVKGKGKIVLGESIKEVFEGSYIYIPKGCKHKVSNPSKNTPLMISEVQLGSYFGEDDIIRYEDKYGRTHEIYE